MPYSDRSHDEVAVNAVKYLSPHVVVDIGAGAGKWGELLRQNEVAVAAVEVWEPYVDEFNLWDKYDMVFVGDIRDGFEFGNSDLLNLESPWIGGPMRRLFVFGDVLEHMTEHDAVRVYDEVRSVPGNEVMVTIPIVHWPQGHEHGNPYEEHIVDDWSIDKVLDAFDGLKLIAGDGEGDLTAVFITW